MIASKVFLHTNSPSQAHIGFFFLKTVLFFSSGFLQIHGNPPLSVSQILWLQPLLCFWVATKTFAQHPWIYFIFTLTLPSSPLFSPHFKKTHCLKAFVHKLIHLKFPSIPLFQHFTVIVTIHYLWIFLVSISKYISWE